MKKIKDYEYYLDTGRLACEVGLQDNITAESEIQQHRTEPDNYYLSLVFQGITEQQIKAIMTIVNALNLQDKML